MVLNKGGEHMLLHVKKDTFDKEVLQSNLPALVDFSAVWCGPCQMMGPVMEKLAAEFQGKAKVAKIDIDQEPALAEKYRIMAVPSFVFFKDGKVAETITGVVPEEVLAKKLDELKK